MDIIAYSKAAKVQNELNQIVGKKPGKNLCNPSECVSGIIDYDGSISENDGYSSSGFLPIENEKTYFFAAVSKTDSTKYANTRHRAALYDASKNFISGTFIDESTTHGLQISVNNSSAKYLRVSVKEAVGVRHFQVEEGTEFVRYDPYVEIPVLSAELGDVPLEQVKQIVTDETEECFMSYEVPLANTAQLFDRSKVTVGYCSDIGYIDPSDSYVYTEKIDVIAGKTIYFSNNGTAKDARFVCAYNSSDEVVSASGMSSEGNTYTVPVGISKIRITYRNPAKTANYDKFQAEYDRITGYVEYKKVFSIDEDLGRVNVLYGKKWAVCGDSFTDGVTNSTLPDGKYAGFKKVYPYFIGNRNNMDIVKFFNGGQTLAFPVEPGDFTNSLTNPSGARYYQNIPADVDYITIYLGINDANHAEGSSIDGEDTTGVIPIGTITDNTTASYYGAWNVVLSWLIANRPNAHIGIIVTNGNAYSDNYRQAQITIAQKYGIPYIDLNGDERTPAMLRTSNPNIASAVKTALIQKWAVDPSSNTHPNDAAHEFESTFIENFLRSI